MLKLQLCLNMIVKNESGRILRALDSVKDHITTFAIFDTGSTDNTVELIEKWGNDNNIKGIVAHGTFIDFSQARNQALDLARSWRKHPDAPWFDALLLMDADMELVVERDDAFDVSHGDMFEMVQKAGAVSYHNPRVLKATSSARYVGVTHEYLDAVPAGCIDGALFIDHADGANRGDKYERDIRLLEADLQRDGGNPRSWFYLGNSYRDSNKPGRALTAYAKRLELGGWDEESFITQCNIAACYNDLGDEKNFVAACLKAYEMRSSRAESLYDMAKYLREKGRHDLAMVFVKAGIDIPRPNDKLFVNDFVYSHGFKEEFSIAGFYQLKNREQAFHHINSLALDKSAPEHTRHLARSNMVHYLRPLKEFMPSTELVKLDFTPNPGFVAMNPSICVSPLGPLECVVRTVNYRIDEAGRYMIGEKGCGDAPIITENWLINLYASTLQPNSAAPIVWHRDPAKFPLVIGLEDMRLFWHMGHRMFSACVREQSATGQCEQWDGELFRKDKDFEVIHCARVSDGSRTEKNWAPGFSGPAYMYRLGALVSDDGQQMTSVGCNYDAGHISGSSQWLRFAGGYLSIVHEAIVHPGHGKRVYQHRLAFYDATLQHLKLSLPFVFQDVQIEFCAGLAMHPYRNSLIASFGVRDCEAWFARFDVVDVFNLLGV